MKKKQIKKQLRKMIKKQEKILIDMRCLLLGMEGPVRIKIQEVKPESLPLVVNCDLQDRAEKVPQQESGYSQEPAEEDPGKESAKGIYGVKWDYSDPKNKPERIGESKGWDDPVPASDTQGEGSSPFDDIYPWKGMAVSTIPSNVVRIMEQELKGSMTDAMVHIPEFYYRAVKNTEEKTWTWEVSDIPRNGFEKHPGSGLYVGRYHTSENNGTLRSVPGKRPLTDTSQTEFRERSKEKGDGWGMLSLEAWSAIQLLYLIEFADFDSCARLGSGYTDEENWKTGVMGQTAGAAYHTIKRSGKSNMYRWIEDPFANCFDWIDGFEGGRKGTFVNGEATGISLPDPEIITGFGYSKACPWAFIPDSSGADLHEGAAGFVYSNTSAYPASVGGNYNALAYYGLFFFYASNAASYTNASLGSRLLYKP